MSSGLLAGTITGTHALRPRFAPFFVSAEWRTTKCQPDGEGGLPWFAFKLSERDGASACRRAGLGPTIAGILVSRF